MSCNKWLPICLLLGLPVAACAATTHHYECPVEITTEKVKHEFDSFRVFDGPPREKGELMPWKMSDGSMGVQSSKKADVYLVCGYSGTKKVVTIHAKQITSCEAPDTGVAWCD